eukprot:1540509-Prymnesium_polylepis.1
MPYGARQRKGTRRNGERGSRSSALGPEGAEPSWPSSRTRGSSSRACECLSNYMCKYGRLPSKSKTLHLHPTARQERLDWWRRTLGIRRDPSADATTWVLTSTPLGALGVQTPVRIRMTGALHLNLHKTSSVHIATGEAHPLQFVRRADSSRILKT